MKQFVSPLKIYSIDPWLRSYSEAIDRRYEAFLCALRSVGDVVEYASLHRDLGFVRDSPHGGWWFREWLPEAYAVTLFGDFNGWNREELPLYRRRDGIWEIFLSDTQFHIDHRTRYKILVTGENGTLERISAMSRYVTEDPDTHNFTGEVWCSSLLSERTPFQPDFSRGLFIYEAHVGMSAEEPRVSTFAEFTQHLIPYIKECGYNCIQLMAIAEHPYYGSFGYHVSNYFAPSSRFGTPDDLRRLIDAAHCAGIAVVMDIVHSHYVKNQREGLNELDGSKHHYSPLGAAGDHPYWDSKVFDFEKPEVVRFLLSNLRYWIEEFDFDGFRFDGVTSMLYYDHGFKDFIRPEQYFDAQVNESAITYLTLANSLIHSIKQSAITLAEEVSGMPALTVSPLDGGMGFDYRLGMSLPDFWVTQLRIPDEQWSMDLLWKNMNNRLSYVPTVGYVESHDQSIVGDKTLAFRLMDSSMYDRMQRNQQSLAVERGMALHKMIRLMTLACGGDAYLNFMGNEFGHPEWVDFPREGNGWSYDHARRLWSLLDNVLLRYDQLGQFDRAMIALCRRENWMHRRVYKLLKLDEDAKTLVFSLNDCIVVFNWHPTESHTDYAVSVELSGEYRIALTSDDRRYGGLGRLDAECKLESVEIPSGAVLYLHNISRAATVYRCETHRSHAEV